MTDSGSPRGRRHNGLDAASYSVVGAVDPRVGEHLLDVLYLYGIAAYLQPAVNLGAALRNTVSLSTTPTDQLWVDRTRATEARTLVVAEAAEAGTEVGSSGHADAHKPQTESSVTITEAEDEAWRDIIASFATDRDATEASPVPPWPVAEDADDTSGPGGSDSSGNDSGGSGSGGAGSDGDDLPRAWPERPPPSPPPSRSLFVRRRSTDQPDQRTPEGQDVFAPRIDDPAYDPDPDPADRYIPPPPPPLPRLTAGAIGAAALVVVGIVILIWPGLLGLGADLTATLGVLALVGGIVGMFWRLRDTRPDDDGPDDGAVV